MKTVMLVVAATTCSVSAFAQSSVTLYGRLDISANRFNLGGTPTRASEHLNTVTSDSSLFGFRGSEDLGGGLQAYFKMENGFQIDTGAQSSSTTFFSRESYVGLGDRQFGSFQFGLQYSPTIFTSSKVDPFFRLGLGSISSILQGNRGYGVIYANSIEYLTPAIAGISGRMLVALSEGAINGNSYAAGVEYAAGPFYAALTHDRSRTAATTVGLTGNPVGTKTWAAGATYDFSVVKLHGWYQINRTDGVPNVNGYLVGVTVPAGQADVRATYTRRNQPNANASLVALGSNYYLSKRTLMYAQVGRVINSDNSAFGLGAARTDQAAAGQLAPGREVSGLSIGIRHTF